MTTTSTGAVGFVVPEGIGDPARASGGNVFDRHLADGLAARGWPVAVIPADGVAASLGPVLSGMPDGALALVDGLVARADPAAVERESERLRVVVVAHMVSAAFPDADGAVIATERRALRAARRVIATSEWTRRVLAEQEGVSPERIVVATPGTAAAERAPGTRHGGSLLCVGVVAPHKGQDVLVSALAGLADGGDWSCTIAGSVAVAPGFASRVREAAVRAGLGDRIRFPGVLDDAGLATAYRSSDVVVAPSRVESYGMAVADAVARGIPVIASEVGGIPQAVGAPGAALFVPPDDPDALRDRLRNWMADPALRERLRRAAWSARGSQPTWSDAVDAVEACLRDLR